MFCFFRSCIEEERPRVSHGRNVRFNEEVVILNIDRRSEFMKSPNHQVISNEKYITDNIEKEEPIFTLS